MLNKVVALARLVAILLAIVAGVIAIPNLNVGLVIVVLSLFSGLFMPAERMLGVGMAVLTLPIVAVAVGMIPAVGTQLSAIASNIALGAAGATGGAIAMRIWDNIKDGLGSLGLGGGS